MHRQASNKFETIKQGQKTVQELIQELTKYAAQMVQYPDDYSFIQKATNSHLKTLSTKRGSIQRYHCRIQ